ncbi:DUF2141 domain-containing protein [Leptolyngbya sp. GB1-A1]|uniref:DUF2141 domain-containing protein n=1 Tax=Leptolyngbya sp. GB1-A1 TaxID=2933908 RepID=UPI00329864A5
MTPLPRSSSSSITLAAQTLVLRIDGLRSQKGVVHLAVFASADGYPKDISRAVRSGSFEVDEALLEIELPDLPYGKYAVTVHHDENMDGQLNFNAIGIPQEGIGFSSNPPIWLGAPSFEKAAFEFDANQSIVSITMKYLLK